MWHTCWSLLFCLATSSIVSVQLLWTFCFLWLRVFSYVVDSFIFPEKESCSMRSSRFICYPTKKEEWEDLVHHRKYCCMLEHTQSHNVWHIIHNIYKTHFYSFPRRKIIMHWLITIELLCVKLCDYIIYFYIYIFPILYNLTGSKTNLFLNEKS